MEEIDKKEWNRLAKRRVQHYGYEFLYGFNAINREKVLIIPVIICLQIDLEKRSNSGVLGRSHEEDKRNDYKGWVTRD